MSACKDSRIESVVLQKGNDGHSYLLTSFHAGDRANKTAQALWFVGQVDSFATTNQWNGSFVDGPNFWAAYPTITMDNVYGTQPNDSGTYTFGITLRNGAAEVGGFLVAYRGASTILPPSVLSKYVAYAHGAISGDGNPKTSSFFQKVLTPPAETTLLYLFFGGCFVQGTDQMNEGPGESSAFSAPSGTPKITDKTPVSLSTWPYLAADTTVPVGGVSYGGYSTEVCTSMGGIDHAFALIIPE